MAKILLNLAWLWLSLLALPSLGAPADGPHQVPLLGDGDMILVPVQVFNKTLYFIADTGFTISAIDSQYEPWLGDPIDAYSAVSPLGTKKTVPVYIAPDISIAGQPANLKTILRLDLGMLRRITGEPCDGILGLDWFAQNVVSINFDDNTFTLEEEIPPEVRNAFAAVPVEETNGFFVLDAVINKETMLPLMIDTGDSGSLSLDPETWQAVFATNRTRTVTATVADAVNQVAQTEVGVVGAFAVQGLNYTNLHAMFIRNPTQPARLGLGFFRRHNVTFDLARGTLYLQPNHHYATPDEEDMSGLHLLRYDGKTVVYSVDAHSPAAAQGIVAEDVIETVNDQPALVLTMSALRQILRSGDGNPVALRLQHGDTSRDIMIVLKKSI
jgi:hypothetical protein